MWKVLVSAGLATLVACTTPVGDVPFQASSSGRYTVELRGHPGASPSFAITHRVEARIVRRPRHAGETNASATLTLYTFDGFDDAFDDRFGPPQWVHPNVIRWPLRHLRGDDVRLIVRNRTDAVIECLFVEAGDLQLFLGLAPASDTTSVIPVSVEGGPPFRHAVGCGSSEQVLQFTSVQDTMVRGTTQVLTVSRRRLEFSTERE